MSQRKEPAGAGRYAERIRAARRAAKVNQQGLADAVGVSRATVAGWETGHSRPDLDLIPSVCDALGLSLNGFFGLGEERSGKENTLLEAFRRLEAGDQQAILYQVSALAEGRRGERGRAVSSSTGRPAPGRSPAPGKRRLSPASPGRAGGIVSLFYSDLSAAAGFGAPLGEESGERVWLRRNERTARADEIIRVNGHSMEPTFQDGDPVLVQHTERLREGEIGVFLVDGEGYVKEYRADGLHSHNPDYPVMTFAEDSDVRCVGRVLGKAEKQDWLSEEELAGMEGQE